MKGKMKPKMAMKKGAKMASKTDAMKGGKGAKGKLMRRLEGKEL